MIKRKYHSLEYPVEVLITGKSRQSCMRLYEQTSAVFSENSYPIGSHTNLYCQTENNVHQLIINNDRDIKFRLRFQPCESSDELLELASQSELIIYCAQFEEDQQHIYSMLIHEIEYAMMALNQQPWPFLIVMTDTINILTDDQHVIDWPEIYREVMELLKGRLTMEPSKLTERGENLLWGLQSASEHHLRTADPFEIASRFAFIYDLDEPRRLLTDGFEWIYHFIGTILSLDKYNRYQFLTFNH